MVLKHRRHAKRRGRAHLHKERSTSTTLATWHMYGCPHCAAGRCGTGHHESQSTVDRVGATIRMALCFLAPAARTDASCPVLHLYDKEWQAVWALLVEIKALKKQVVEWCVSKIVEAGYRGEWVCLQSDGEASRTAIKSAVGAARVGRTGLIRSFVRESQANGACEEGINVFHRQMRTFKHHCPSTIVG